MNQKYKIMVIYMATFALILINVPIFSGSTTIEILLRNSGVNTFHSNGETGFYYPSLIILAIGFIFWGVLRRVAPKSKFSKDYFYYCFGMIMLVAIANNIVW